MGWYNASRGLEREGMLLLLSPVSVVWQRVSSYSSTVPLLVRVCGLRRLFEGHAASRAANSAFLPAMPGLVEHRVGGNAGDFDGFTHTFECVNGLEVEDELLQVRASRVKWWKNRPVDDAVEAGARRIPRRGTS